MEQRRILRIPGGHNFRDMGGYPTIDGRSVKWGTLYRSGVMSQIHAKDAEALRQLGIVRICDFRTKSERSRKPTTWHEGSPIELMTIDYEMSLGALKTLVKEPGADSGRVRELILNLYTNLADEQIANYAVLFRQLAAGKVPLVFNCSAGKDRTGIAAALVLSVLQVPMDDIVADYMLTNDAIDGLIAILEQEPNYGRWVAEQPDTLRPLLRAEPEYLEWTFAALDERYGGVEGYLTRCLGITTGQIEKIRANLLD